MPRREGHENAALFTISICLVFVACAGLLRAWIRRSAYGRDDAIIAAATLLSLSQFGASYAAVGEGLGTPWSGLDGLAVRSDLAPLNQASIASVVMFFIALYLSKCAMLAFLSRITKTHAQILLYHTLNSIVALLGVLSIVVVLAGCAAGSGYYWAFSQNATTCPSQGARWQAVVALDLLTELLLLILPVHLVWNLHMPTKKKAMILVAFWVRLPALCFCLVRTWFTLRLDKPNADAGLDSAFVLIWLEVEMAYAIGSSTLSAMKSYTDSYNTGFGMGFARGKGEDSYGLSNVSGSSGQSSRGEKAKSASPTTSRTDRSAKTASKGYRGPETCMPPITAHGRNVADPPPLKLRPDTAVASYTSVSAGPDSDVSPWHAGSSIGSDSSGDDNLVIMRETVYEVQHDEAPMLPIAVHRA
ncbi:hypothetical protein DOTSEDRAFT_50149 [Dothistroma septosporum NZE10]|uniref:Rhodopsin domain-containing protein n=1 Tax=Dothistroma septosporum (strain NZE10 / CBS 128990) TaxID=675120 RepID=N1Q429_DOTSN|nr:hypothetical protein DOTSEDRAFT_50149 [Dothistroma septosporum NZE10]